MRVLAQYARRLQAAGGLLMLVGVNAKVHEQLAVTGTLATLGAENVFAEQPRVGSALMAAMQKADAWIAAEASD